MPLLDFAAVWAEHVHADDPLVARVHALDLDEPEEHQLPESMPAGLRLHMWDLRDKRGDDGRLTFGDLQAAGRYLFGAATFQRWLDARITEDQLREVVLTVLAVYSAREAAAAGDSDDDEGKADPPRSGDPATSSPTSGPSKPTSNASTGSTSPERSG